LDTLDPTSLDCPPFIRTVSSDDSAASDLTGQLPVESRRTQTKQNNYERLQTIHEFGNNYILITTYRGYIHFTPQKSRSDFFL
jgi:hypothetical protein